MECLVKTYNKDQISNLFSVFSFKPQKVIFLYDKTSIKPQTLHFVKAAINKKFSTTQVVYKAFDPLSVIKTKVICQSIIDDNPRCCFDLTGSGGICAISAYLACIQNSISIFKLNLNNYSFVDICNAKQLESQFAPTPLDISSVLLANGANFAGNHHPTPGEADFKNILDFCDLIFKKLDLWKELCYYLQLGVANFPHVSRVNYFDAPKIVRGPKGDIGLKNYFFLQTAAKFGFIRDLQITNSKIMFYFKNIDMKRYLTDFGVWLELYTYIKLRRETRYFDVNVSVKVDWDREFNEYIVVSNEIDAMFFYKTRPCFVSCKLSEPSTDALQELSMYKNYFGGRESRAILVTLANISKKTSYVYKRAKGMGISIVDGNDILGRRFLQAVQNSLA